MADTANAADVVRPIKARTKRAASHLRAVTTETAAETADGAHGLVQSLGEQVGALAQQVEQFAEDRYGDAREIAGNVADAGAVVAGRAGRQTVAAANAIRRDPLPALVALGVVGLLLALLFGRSAHR
jgi:hypothetical protein